MKLNSMKLAVVPFACLLSATVSQAAVLNFSYSSQTGPVISGSMLGDLQLDGNTFIVSSMGSVFLDAVPAPELPFIYSTDGFIGLNLLALPTATVDGSFLDFVVCATSSCAGTDAIVFASGDLYASSVAGGPIFQATGAYGDGSLLPYDPAQWSARVTADSSAPEPGTFGLGIAAGLMVIGWRKCRYAWQSGEGWFRVAGLLRRSDRRG
jgi:hypothetical protein